MRDYHISAAVAIPAAIGLVLWFLRRKSDINGQGLGTNRVHLNENKHKLEYNSNGTLAEQEIHHNEIENVLIYQKKPPENPPHDPNSFYLHQEATNLTESIKHEVSASVDKDDIEIVKHKVSTSVDKGDIETVKHEISASVDKDNIETVKHEVIASVDKGDIETVNHEVSTSEDKGGIETVKHEVSTSEDKGDIETVNHEVSTSEDKGDIATVKHEVSTSVDSDIETVKHEVGTSVDSDIETVKHEVNTSEDKGDIATVKHEVSTSEYKGDIVTVKHEVSTSEDKGDIATVKHKVSTSEDKGDIATVKHEVSTSEYKGDIETMKHEVSTSEDKGDIETVKQDFNASIEKDVAEIVEHKVKASVVKDGTSVVKYDTDTVKHEVSTSVDSDIETVNLEVNTSVDKGDIVSVKHEVSAFVDKGDIEAVKHEVKSSVEKGDTEAVEHEVKTSVEKGDTEAVKYEVKASVEKGDTEAVKHEVKASVEKGDTEAVKHEVKASVEKGDTEAVKYEVKSSVEKGDTEAVKYEVKSSVEKGDTEAVKYEVKSSVEKGDTEAVKYEVKASVEKGDTEAVKYEVKSSVEKGDTEAVKYEVKSSVEKGDTEAVKYEVKSSVEKGDTEAVKHEVKASVEKGDTEAVKHEVKASVEKGDTEAVKHEVKASVEKGDTEAVKHEVKASVEKRHIDGLMLSQRNFIEHLIITTLREGMLEGVLKVTRSDSISLNHMFPDLKTLDHLVRDDHEIGVEKMGDVCNHHIEVFKPGTVQLYNEYINEGNLRVHTLSHDLSNTGEDDEKVQASVGALKSSEAKSFEDSPQEFSLKMQAPSFSGPDREKEVDNSVKELNLQTQAPQSILKSDGTKKDERCFEEYNQQIKSPTLLSDSYGTVSIDSPVQEVNLESWAHMAFIESDCIKGSGIQPQDVDIKVMSSTDNSLSDRSKDSDMTVHEEPSEVIQVSVTNTSDCEKIIEVHLEDQLDCAKSVESYAESQFDCAKSNEPHLEGRFDCAKSNESHAESQFDCAESVESDLEDQFDCAKIIESHVESQFDCAKSIESHNEDQIVHTKSIELHLEDQFDCAESVESDLEDQFDCAQGVEPHLEYQSDSAKNTETTGGQFDCTKSVASHAEDQFDYAKNKSDFEGQSSHAINSKSHPQEALIQSPVCQAVQTETRDCVSHLQEVDGIASKKSHAETSEHSSTENRTCESNINRTNSPAVRTVTSVPLSASSSSSALRLPSVSAPKPSRHIRNQGMVDTSSSKVLVQDNMSVQGEGKSIDTSVLSAGCNGTDIDEITVRSAENDVLESRTSSAGELQRLHCDTGNNRFSTNSRLLGPSASSVDILSPEEVDSFWGIDLTTDNLNIEASFVDTNSASSALNSDCLPDETTVSCNVVSEKHASAMADTLSEVHNITTGCSGIGYPTGFENTTFSDKGVMDDSSELLHSPVFDCNSEGSNDSGRGGSEHDITCPGGETLQCFDFNIPTELCGLLIGKQGKNISKVKSRTGARVSLVNNPFTTEYQVCQIIGTQAEVNDALGMIRRRFPLQDYPYLTMVPVNMSATLPVEPSQQFVVPDVMQLSLPRGVSVEVVVTAIVHAGQLFVQQAACDSVRSLEELTYHLNLAYAGYHSAPGVPSPVQSGVICVCESEGCWYRVMAVSPEDENGLSQIRFLDFGGYAVVPVSVLKQIRTDFMSLPFQAVECFMANIIPNPNERFFTREATLALSEMTMGKLIQCQVVAHNEYGIPYVHLYQINSKNNSALMINRALVKRRLVSWLEVLKFG